jgi:uncharacterized protein YqjF (DUF2071 family)
MSRVLPPPLLRVRLADVAFLHWPVPAATARALVPPSLEPDAYDGVCYVGLVLLQLRGAGPLGVPVPWLGSFGQVNVRLYVRDRAGRRGVMFRAMDAGRLVPAAAARAAGLPYAWARVRIERHGADVRYDVRRRWPQAGDAAARVTVRVGRAITAPDRLETWLTEVPALFRARRAGIIRLPLVHPPWPLHHAAASEVDAGLIAAAGLPHPSSPPASVLWSPGVTARFARPRLDSVGVRR